MDAGCRHSLCLSMLTSVGFGLLIVVAPEAPGKLEIGDEQALMMKEESNKSGKTKVRPAVSWLRRTEYMGTDLYDAVHKVCAMSSVHVSLAFLLFMTNLFCC